jgi:hypothetical protein
MVDRIRFIIHLRKRKSEFRQRCSLHAAIASRKKKSGAGLQPAAVVPKKPVAATERFPHRASAGYKPAPHFLESYLSGFQLIEPTFSAAACGVRRPGAAVFFLLHDENNPQRRQAAALHTLPRIRHCPHNWKPLQSANERVSCVRSQG